MSKKIRRLVVAGVAVTGLLGAPAAMAAAPAVTAATVQHAPASDTWT